MPSRTTVEWAVRKIVVAISSAIEASALPTICCVTGSMRVVLKHAPDDPCSSALQDERLGLELPTDGPAGADDDGGVVLVDQQRPGLGGLADRGASPDGRIDGIAVEARGARCRGNRTRVAELQ